MYGVDLYKNKKIMNFFINKIEKHDDLVKKLNKYYARTSFFGLFKSILIPVSLITGVGFLAYFLINNGMNNLSLLATILLLISPTLSSVFLLKLKSKNTEKLKEKISIEIEKNNILNVNEDDFREWKDIFNENEFSFILDSIKEKRISSECIIENIRLFASTKNERKLTVNDNTSQKEIGEHLVKQEAYIEEQFYFYKSKKESLLKKKELINSIIEKGKGE